MFKNLPVKIVMLGSAISMVCLTFSVEAAHRSGGHGRHFNRGHINRGPSHRTTINRNEVHRIHGKGANINRAHTGSYYHNGRSYKYYNSGNYYNYYNNGRYYNYYANGAYFLYFVNGIYYNHLYNGNYYKNCKRVAPGASVSSKWKWVNATTVCY